LRASKDWVVSNQNVAEFWTNTVRSIVNVKDAIAALEACFHYIEFDDFEEACNVILKRRDLEEYSYSPRLGSSFYRIGLPQQMIAAITRVINNIKPGYSLGKLYNLLGDQYWAIGNLNRAVECHQESTRIVKQSLVHCEDNASLSASSTRDRLDILAIFNIGLCKIELWELEEAKKLFEEYIFQFSDDHNINNSTLMISYAWLAFIYLLKEEKKSAIQYVEKSYQIYHGFTALYKPWGLINGLFVLGLSHKNLGELEKSFDSYQRVVLWAEQRGFIQVKARAIGGMAEVYREKQDFDEAFLNHIEAIEILKNLGAKGHLAEAYYQFGITYQVIGEIEKSNTNFQEAVRLFGEMEAPRQVERVRKSMQN